MAQFLQQPPTYQRNMGTNSTVRKKFPVLLCLLPEMKACILQENGDNTEIDRTVKPMYIRKKVQEIGNLCTGKETINVDMMAAMS